MELDLRNPELNTQQTLEQVEAEAINLIDNFQVNSVRHLPQLKTLRIAGYCGVDQTGIDGLTNLTELDISYNPKITDLSFMTQLVKLKAAGNCWVPTIPDSVTYLDLSYNTRIQLDTLPNLKVLIARGPCTVTPTNVPSSVEVLDVADNPNF